MKKFLALLLALVMVFALAACGETESTPTDTPDDTQTEAPEATEPVEEGGEEATFLPGGGSNIVYVITPATSNVFFATEAEVARAKAEELGYEVKTVSHDDDASRQLEAIEAAIADKAAFIILDNAGADATIEAVQAAYDQGIPCFLIDREINTTGIAVAQIVADNAQGAAAIAEKWVEAMGYEGKYAELLGLESDTNCQVRSDNFHSVIDQYPDLEMVAQQSANWDQTEAYEKTEAILEANPEITGIICGNDTMACGAAAACADAGRTDIKIIGVDGSDDAAALIKSGQMVGTALQQCALIAKMAVEQAHYYINNNGAALDGVGEKQLVPCIAIPAGTEGDYTGEVQFDASAEAAGDWELIAEELTGTAQPLVDTLASAANGSAYCVSFTGTVEEYNTDSPKGYLVVSVEGVDDKEVRVQVGSVFSGTTVRDCQTSKAYEDFTNQTEWSQYAKTVNDEVMTNVIEPLGDLSALVGKTVEIVGCFTPESTTVTVTPVAITAQ